MQHRLCPNHRAETPKAGKQITQSLIRLPRARWEDLFRLTPPSVVRHFVLRYQRLGALIAGVPEYICFACAVSGWGERS